MPPAPSHQKLENPGSPATVLKMFPKEHEREFSFAFTLFYAKMSSAVNHLDRACLPPSACLLNTVSGVFALCTLFHRTQKMPMPMTRPAAKSPRRPKQERGHTTVSEILGATRTLLRRLPLDDITTTRIARRARISIGGLYRFFPDKQSIVDAIAVHHVRAFRQLVQTSIIGPLLAVPQDFETFDPAFVLNAIIDTYVIYLDTNRDFRAIAFGRHISPATHERESSPETGLPALIKNFMLEQLGIPNTPELDLKLRVVSEAGERLIAYAFEQPTVDDRDRIIAEMKKLLAGYLFGGN